MKHDVQKVLGNDKKIPQGVTKNLKNTYNFQVVLRGQHNKVFPQAYEKQKENHCALRNAEKRLVE